MAKHQALQETLLGKKNVIPAAAELFCKYFDALIVLINPDVK